MNAELIVIAIFATYRITLLLSAEKGPADIFGKIRSRMGVKYDQYSNAYGTNWLSEGVLCPYCLSVWVGIGVALFIFAAGYFNIENVVIYILLPFALSGASVFLFKWAGV